MKYSLICGIAILSLSPAIAFPQETERVYLSGRDKDHTVDWEFLCTTGNQSGQWTTIPVPSHWDVLGFGKLNYKKDIGTALEERGLYKYRFEVPQDWSTRRVQLVFEGVMTDTTVKINGTSTGPTHQGGLYRFQYEVTDLLKPGEENLLEVDVAKHSANESVNRAERTADYWVFGGIYRPVYLEIVPTQYIERVAIDARANGEFTAEVFLDLKNSDAAYRVAAQVLSLDGAPIGESFEAPVEASSLERREVSLSTKIDAPKPWSAEKPNLYRVEFQLLRDEQVIHTTAERFGFRTVEVRPEEGIFVNGRRVILKGVNRHSTWPDSGRCLSEAVHRLDIETIKAMNMNAVRTSHYPPDQAFLDLCDELGLYVLDELAGWHWHYDTRVGSKLVKEMVVRDVNHPSILFWNNGNEGGNNVALDEQFGWYDPQQRTVLHPWEAFNYVNTAHYLEYERARVASRGAPTRHGPGAEYQEWEDLNDPNKYIYMPTEMLHGLYDGGSGAGLADYWSMMQESPVLGGAFLWVLFDGGIKRADNTIDTAGNQAPDGIVGPYREREGSFYTVQELWAPLQISRQGKQTLKLDNQYSFTNANECELTWQLRKFRQPSDSEADFDVVAENSMPLPDIAPGMQGTMQLQLPDSQQQADALAVSVSDPNGRELWTWVWPIAELAAEDWIIDVSSEKNPTISQQDGKLSITAGELQLSFDEPGGRLSQIVRAGHEFSLGEGPVCTAGDSSFENLRSQTDGDHVVVTVKYSGPLKKVEWRIAPSGWLHCTYTYQAKGEYDYLGVTFQYPRALVRGKRWLGDGPFRVWKNRRHGAKLNVWQNKLNDTITGYRGWDYPEFAGCFANVHWMQLQTVEGPITIVPEQQDKFVQVLLPEQPPEQLRGQTEFALPDCGIALLDAIPPVGSKFKTAETTGPHGQPNVVDGEFTGKVSFFFGEFP